MTPLTKMADQIVSAATIPTMVREAFRVAQLERPGPVHLELPEDIAHAAAPDMRRSRRTRSIADRVSRRARTGSSTILEAKRPLIMLGAAASRPRLSDALSEFVRRVQTPYFNTQMGKGAVTGGRTSTWARRPLGARLRPSRDRSGGSHVAIGHDTVEKPPFSWARRGQPCCMSDISRRRSRKCSFRKRNSSATSAYTLRFWPIALRIDCRERRRLLTLREDILAHIAERAEESRFPPTPQRIVHDVRQVMPEDGIVCLDNGMYKIWFARNYRTHAADTLGGLTRRDPRPHCRPGGGEPLPADAAAHRPRCATCDARRRDRLPRQRHVQDLVCAQLPHPCREHAASRQCARHDRWPVASAIMAAASIQSGACSLYAAMAAS